MDKLNTLTITQPDDWHLHLRDDAFMRSVLGHTAARFGRAIVMPNLKPPIVTTAQAEAYRKRIIAALPKDSRFTPLVTLYLTDNTPPDEITRAKQSGIAHAVKYYPAGATTNSDDGVTDMKKVYPVLERMEKEGMPLLVHGEVTDSKVDIFDREKVFIDQVLDPLVRRYPRLKIVLEHITTEEGVAFVGGAPLSIAATITAHHLLLNRNAMLVGGMRPHNYCLPVLKREKHRRALVRAATSGNPKFFLGTDSAPHAVGAKESACGCGGIFTAHAAIELYAEVFDQADSLEKFEGFASHFGADFYGLPRNTDTITLERSQWMVPPKYAFGDTDVVPLRAGEFVAWTIRDPS